MLRSGNSGASPASVASMASTPAPATPSSAPPTPAPTTPFSPQRQSISHATENPRFSSQSYQSYGSPTRHPLPPPAAAPAAAPPPRHHASDATITTAAAATTATLSPPPQLVTGQLPPHRPVQEYHNAFFADGALVSGLPSLPPASSTAAHHRRPQSVPNLLPIALINRATSPERRSRQPQPPQQRLPALSVFDMPLTGDGRRCGTNSDSASSARGVLAGWFSGGGATSPSPSPSNRRGRPIGDDDIPSPRSAATTPDTTPTRRMRPDSQQPPRSTGSPSSATSSRFGFLASGMSAISSALNAKTQQSPTSDSRGGGGLLRSSPATTLEDEILNMNVEAALFPNGPPTERDTFSPAAFKNLHVASVALSRRLQAAYRDQAVAARELGAERDAQRDELEEAETRAVHLKMQLEGMALKAAEQERAMRELADELAAELRKNAKLLQQFHQQQLLQQQPHLLSPILPATTVASEGSVSEDLGVDADQQRRRHNRRRRRHESWRGSGETTKSSELSFDTEGEMEEDDESVESESVFSRSRSPTIAQSSSTASMFDGGASSVVDGPLSTSSSSMQHPKVTALKSPTGLLATARQQQQQQQQQQQPMTAFQKLVKNVTAAARGPDEEAPYSGSGCRNCKGQDASVAWNTVSLLRDENRGLKQRVGQLEVAVEGALDLVNGVGL